MRVALIQMSVTADRARNITAACQHIRRAAEGGADMAVLPEMFCCPYDNGCFRAYGETAGGPAQMALSQIAAELGIYVVGGSLPELEGGKVYNTSYVYGRRGSFWQSTGRSTCSTSTWREASALWSRTLCPPGTRSPPLTRNSA